jgi:small conductance mechanosensitive channel
MNDYFAKTKDLLMQKPIEWYEYIISMLPNFVLAIIVVILFALLAKFARNLSEKLLNRVSDKPVVNGLLSTTTYIVVLTVGLFIALNVLQLEKAVSSLLAGAGIIGLALGFAFQNISANFISGVIIAFRKPFSVNDIIESYNHMGRVEAINLRSTVIETFQGLHVIIPNQEVLNKALINYTRTHIRRIDLEIGVSYSEDLQKVKEVTLQTIKSLDFVLSDKPIELYYEEFGDSSINYLLVFWIEYPDEPGYLSGRSEAIMAIKAAYDKAGITIPFPIRTLDFKNKLEVAQ